MTGINTNPLEGDNTKDAPQKKVKTIPLFTPLQMKCIDSLTYHSAKAVFEMLGKSDTRGYSREVFPKMLTNAFIKDNPLCIFDPMIALEEIAYEMETAPLMSLLSSLTANYKNQLTVTDMKVAKESSSVVLAVPFFTLATSNGLNDDASLVLHDNLLKEIQNSTLSIFEDTLGFVPVLDVFKEWKKYL